MEPILLPEEISVIDQLSEWLKIVQAPKPPSLGALNLVPPELGGLGGPG